MSHLKVINGAKVDVELVAGNGARTWLTINQTPPDFTYAGRVWANASDESKRAKHPIYFEITAQQCQDMRKQATEVLGLATRWQEMLNNLARERTN